MVGGVVSGFSRTRSSVEYCVGEHTIGGDDGHVLSAVPATIRDRIGIASSLEPRRPQLFAALHVEGPESVVVGRGNEHESARRDDGTRQERPAGVLLLGRQLISNA